MIDLYGIAAKLQAICYEHRWKFCFIGGIAVQRWGEPRVTQDVDATILTGFQNEEQYLSVLLHHFAARIEDAFRFAVENRVLLLKSATGVGIDISLGGLTFEESAVARASVFEFLPDLSLLTCSAEDLIVFKAFANRPRDWNDIEGILSRQQYLLDWDYVCSHLKPLIELKEEPDILERLMQMKAQLEN